MMVSVKSQRPRLSHPYLDESLRLWIYAFARKNLWRVAAWIDYDDLVQDGFLCYSICQEKYGNTLDQRHFMALFMRTFERHIILLANKKTMLMEVHVDPDFFDISIGASPKSVVTLNAELDRAPKGIRQVIELLLSDEWHNEPWQRQSMPKGHIRGVRESTNQRIARFLEFRNDDTDWVGIVQNYLRRGCI